MKYAPRTHTPESFQLALAECLKGDYRKKTLRRQQLQQLLVDMGACRQRREFSGMTLTEAWDVATDNQLEWWLRRVFSHTGRPDLIFAMKNILNLATLLTSGPREKYQTMRARRARAVRLFFGPAGNLIRRWE